MKRLFVIVTGLLGAGLLLLSAADTPKATSGNPDRERVWKQVLEKYDTNKDGKLDREERAKVSPDDVRKMQEVGILGGSPKKKTR